MIIVIEVARREGDVVVTSHLAHEHLLPLHLRLLWVHSQISNCKIHLWLMYSFRGTRWLQVAAKLHFVPAAQRVENTWFVSPNQLERDCRQIARQKSKGRLRFLTVGHFSPIHDGGSDFSARCARRSPWVYHRIRHERDAREETAEASSGERSIILSPEKQENFYGAESECLR